MKARAFVQACRQEKDALLSVYRDSAAGSQVGERLESAGLSVEQNATVLAALDIALTDAFYAVLLGLDGSASLGGEQQAYRLFAEDGQLVSDGTGDLEAAAYEIFQAG